MVPTTIVNALTVVHKDSDGIATCSAPDVCKTPPQPVPLPYTNVAFSKDLVKGTTTVFVDGQMVAIKDCEFSTSTGDEPGSVGGVSSGCIKGWAKFSNYSTDVFFEGRNVCRLTDPMIMNGNNPNTATVAEGQGNIQDVLGDKMDLLCRAFCFCDGGGDGDDFVKIEQISGEMA